MVNLCILAAISLFIGVGGILTVSLVYSLTGRTVPLDYGVVVDAGSTHSQIILYKWEGDKENGTGEVSQQQSCYVKGGLALNTDPDAAAESLIGCLTNISNALPNGQASSTPIFLGATAGFRLLNESNSTLSTEILQKVNETFGTFGFNPEQVRILTGQEEGLYAWITSNFLSRTLMGQPPISTIGALDLGGASTQIAYSVPEEDDSSCYLKLYGSDYNVSSTSSLCFGVEQSYQRYLTQLILSTGGNETNISEPCAPKNYTFERSGDELFGSPCTMNTRHLIETLETNYMFNGTGDPASCKASVATLMNRTVCDITYGHEHCFQPVSPPTTAKFYAFSSFFYTVNFLNVTTKGLNEFQGASVDLCQKSWDEVKEMPTTSNDTLPVYCFQAVLIENMLTQQYLFNESTWQNINFVKKINKADVGWSLGYMINATNAIPAEVPTSPSISLVAMILIVIVCVTLLGLGAFFIWKRKGLPSEVSYIQV